MPPKKSIKQYTWLDIKFALSHAIYRHAKEILKGFFTYTVHFSLLTQGIGLNVNILTGCGCVFTHLAQRNGRSTLIRVLLPVVTLKYNYISLPLSPMVCIFTLMVYLLQRRRNIIYLIYYLEIKILIYSSVSILNFIQIRRWVLIASSFLLTSDAMFKRFHKDIVFFYSLQCL